MIISFIALFFSSTLPRPNCDLRLDLMWSDDERVISFRGDPVLLRGLKNPITNRATLSVWNGSVRRTVSSKSAQRPKVTEPRYARDLQCNSRCERSRAVVLWLQQDIRHGYLGSLIVLRALRLHLGMAFHLVSALLYRKLAVVTSQQSPSILPVCKK